MVLYGCVEGVEGGADGQPGGEAGQTGPGVPPEKGDIPLPYPIPMP